MALLLSAILLVLCFALAHSRRAALRRLAGERAAMQALVRLVRLSAGDLRGAAVALLGHAQASGEAGAVLRVQALLLEVTDALLAETDGPGGQEVREEAVRLGPVLAAAVAVVSGQLGAGRRAWRVAAAIDAVELLTDRRALQQVLVRVLTSAALATRDGDWIAVSAAGDAEGWVLTVEDEGAGLAVAQVRGEGRETRGLGVGLSLARALMQAHGGTLAMESAPLIGTRALLRFPRARVLSARSS